MGKIICLDLDDTLIQTQESYEKINRNLIDLLQKNVSISSKEILEVQCNIDMDLIKTDGFSKDRFPTSWVKTFGFFLNQSLFSENHVYKEAHKIFSDKISLHEDAKRFLMKARNENCVVWIVTHGDVKVQNKRIEDAGLQWVDRIVISDHKNLELYQSLKGQTSQELIMIGNSVRHDILPAIEAGFKAIHIQREMVWKYDISNSKHRFPSFKSLDHLDFRYLGGVWYESDLS